jgi:plastocyanin
LRVINQPYIPENAIVNVDTTVTWLNADAGHRHSITTGSVVSITVKGREFVSQYDRLMRLIESADL